MPYGNNQIIELDDKAIVRQSTGSGLCGGGYLTGARSWRWSSTVSATIFAQELPPRRTRHRELGLSRQESGRTHVSSTVKRGANSTASSRARPVDAAEVVEAHGR